MQLSIFWKGVLGSMNVLITSASRKVDLVKTFQRAVGEFGNGRVIAVDISPFSPALYVADSARLVSRSDDPQFLDEILSLCRQEEIKVLVPTRDEELPVFAEAKGRFADAGVTIMVAEPEVIRTCQDKSLFSSFCASNGFEVPKVYKTPNEVGESDFPVFVRGCMSKGSRSAFRVDNARQLQYICDSVAGPLIQEFVISKEYTIDLFADFQGRVISVVPRERISVVSGESFISRTTKSWDLINAAVKIAEELKLIGHNTIQCFFDGTVVKFIEVNPRFGGAAALGFAAGACTPLFLLRICQGEKLQPAIGNFQGDLAMLRYTQDMFRTLESLSEAKRLD